MASDLRGPLPVKVDATSNGEFRPVPLTEPVARANSEAELRIGEHAKRVGLGRRAFLQSLCGAATTLLTLNEAFAALGNIGGLFRVPKESAFEPAAARRGASRRRVHLRRADPHGRPGWPLGAAPPANIGSKSSPTSRTGPAVHDDPVDCFSAEQFIKHVFMDSDTDLAVLSFVPELPENNPLSLEEANRVRVLVDRMDGAQRLFLHAMVVPNAGPDMAPLQLMKDAVDRYPDRSLEVLHAMGPERPRLCTRQSRRWHPIHRAGARARRAQHLHP